MEQKDFNLYTASFSVSHSNKNVIQQLVVNIDRLEQLVNKHLDSKEKGIKSKIKEVQKKIELMVVEKTTLEKNNIRYEKVFNKIDKKYFG